MKNITKQDWICLQNRDYVASEVPELKAKIIGDELVPYRLKVELNRCKGCEDFNRIQYNDIEYLICLKSIQE